MSLVLDREGRLYNYDINNNKLSDAIDCDFTAKKIINRYNSSYVLSTDGHLYVIIVISVKICEIGLNFFAIDFLFESRRNIFYLLSNDNTLYSMNYYNFKITKMVNHKIIKMTSLGTSHHGCNYYTRVSLFITDSNTIMYLDHDNNFVELDRITDTEKAPPLVTLVTTCSIKEDLLFFTDKFNFQYRGIRYCCDPNRLAYVPSTQYIALPISIAKYFKLSNYAHLYDIYVDNDNNKYLWDNTVSVPQFKKLPLLVDYDVNLPKITNTKSSRNVVI